MKKNIKKISAVISILLVVIGAFLLGKTQTEVATQVIRMETIPEGYVKWDKENYIDMRHVIGWTAEDGLQLYLDNGEGYYLEK